MEVLGGELLPPREKEGERGQSFSYFYAEKARECVAWPFRGSSSISINTPGWRSEAPETCSIIQKSIMCIIYHQTPSTIYLSNSQLPPPTPLEPKNKNILLSPPPPPRPPHIINRSHHPPLRHRRHGPQPPIPTHNLPRILLHITRRAMSITPTPR